MPEMAASDHRHYRVASSARQASAFDLSSYHPPEYAQSRFASLSLPALSLSDRPKKLVISLMRALVSTDVSHPSRHGKIDFALYFVVIVVKSSVGMGLLVSSVALPDVT
jgi:hypothetical protein